MRKTTLILLLFSVALVVWLLGEKQRHAASQALTQAREEKGQLDANITQATSYAKQRREQLLAAQLQRDKTIAALKKADRDFSKSNPDARWSQPPGELPNWNADCPYVWLHKDILNHLPVQPFTPEGKLRDDVATVLTVAPAARKALEERLTQIVANARELELTNIEWLDKPLPDMGDDGPVVTLRVNPVPDQGSLLKAQFASCLKESLGQQREDLLMQLADGWFTSQFSSVGNEPKTFSVIHQPNGFYRLSYKAKWSSGTIGGDLQVLSQSVPPHFLNLITKALDEADNSSTPASP